MDYSAVTCFHKSQSRIRGTSPAGGRAAAGKASRDRVRGVGRRQREAAPRVPPSGCMGNRGGARGGREREGPGLPPPARAVAEPGDWLPRRPLHTWPRIGASRQSRREKWESPRPRPLAGSWRRGSSRRARAEKLQGQKRADEKSKGRPADMFQLQAPISSFKRTASPL